MPPPTCAFEGSISAFRFPPPRLASSGVPVRSPAAPRPLFLGPLFIPWNVVGPAADHPPLPSAVCVPCCVWLSKAPPYCLLAPRLPFTPQDKELPAGPAWDALSFWLGNYPSCLFRQALSIKPYYSWYSLVLGNDCFWNSLKVILDLEEERQRHAQDTAEGDDVTYMLEKERERLTQQVTKAEGWRSVCQE